MGWWLSIEEEGAGVSWVLNLEDCHWSTNPPCDLEEEMGKWGISGLQPCGYCSELNSDDQWEGGRACAPLPLYQRNESTKKTHHSTSNRIPERWSRWVESQPQPGKQSNLVWTAEKEEWGQRNPGSKTMDWIGLDPLAHHYTYTPQSPLSHSNSSAVISFGGLIMAFALPAVPIAAFPTSFSFSSTHRKISRKCADGKEINAVQGKREKSSMPFLSARFTPLV